MLLRVFSFLILLIFCTSCDYFSPHKKENINKLDTIVDFSTVDVSPSFSVCDSLIEKSKKSDCFRTTIHQLIAKKLSSSKLIVKDSIDEVVHVHLLINSQGKIVFKELKSSVKIKKELPELDSLIKNSVEALPKIYPAIKRGIPVTTQYQLPISINTKD